MTYNMLEKSNSTITKSKRLFQENLTGYYILKHQYMTCDMLVKTLFVIFVAKFSHNQKNNSEETFSLDESGWEGQARL